ncbi:MAG TPA: cytochrome b N-terminal domain-containing protein [Lacipirellulaceae bacterium]|nr:cytochrome b N-terminal domain-containing protein [Lacipirellulaceae bacterium]
MAIGQFAMVKNLSDWLDNRTGYRSLVHAALYEPVPGGSRWRYVWGSTLVMAFATQAITGIFLWMAYSPSTQTAWESVFYIQHEMWGGWLLRGVHHFMAQAMVVLLAIHFVQVVWDGAYRAPRELNFVIGLLLMLVVLGLALTGYLLPWDQKGYWATTVGTNLASQTPLVGGDVRKLAIGGSDYGHLTLTRFFALHAGVLPGLLVAGIAAHVALFRRHGLHARAPRPGVVAMFWPDQVLKDSIAALGVLAAVLGLTVYYGGAELMAPADPANPYNAARPEWYFLFLFQFLKWFPGELELWGAFIIPGVVLAVLFAMPWIGRSRAGHLFNVGLLVVLLGGAALLTAQAMYDDYRFQFDGQPTAENEPSRQFLIAKRQAAGEAERVVELAMMPERIPPTGALAMSYDDAYLQGPRLFTQYCASCHNHRVSEGLGIPANVDPREFRDNAHKAGLNLVDVINPNPTAPNLWEVGNRAWMQAMLSATHIVEKDYLGYKGSPFLEGDMVSFVKDMLGPDMTAEERQAGEDALLKVADALWLEAGTADLVHPQAMEQLEARAAEGRELMTGKLAEVVDGGMSCTDCHKFHGDGDIGAAPDLTGYMSRQWMIDFISNPADERFYGDRNDRMPAFAPHDDAQLNQLDAKSLGLIVDWLRGDWRRAEVSADNAVNEAE